MDATDSQLRLLLTHDSFIRRIARGLVDAGTVDDVVQATWWAAARRPPSSRPILPWLAKVARRLALNARRSDARRRAREVRAAVPEALPSAAALLEREAVRRRVVEAVLALPEPLQITVLLRYFEGVPPRGIARRMAVPVETVRSRLKRALAILREALASGDFGDLHGLGTALWSLAGGPKPGGAATAVAAGKTALLGALAMSTGSKVAAAVFVVLMVVGVAVVPSWMAGREEAHPEAPLLPASDAAGPAASPRPPMDPIRPRPSPESPIAAEPAAPTALEVEVIGPTGRPAARARLLLHRGKEVLGQATTGDDGLASFRSGEGEAEIVVLPDGAPIHFATLPLAAGRRRIELPPGSSITGRVEVNGTAPPEPVKLTFTPAIEDERLHEFVGVLRFALAATCTPSASGDFEFAGVPEGSEWRIGPAVSGYHDWRAKSASGYRVEGVLRDGAP